MAPRRLRSILFIASLLLVGVSLALLAYAIWPSGTLQEQVILAPTLFAPP